MGEAECNQRGESKILTVFRLFIIEFKVYTSSKFGLGFKWINTLPMFHSAVRSKAVVLLLLTFSLLLLPLWESVIVLCFIVRYFMSILVLQPSWWGRESWLLYFACLPGDS